MTRQHWGRLYATREEMPNKEFGTIGLHDQCGTAENLLSFQCSEIAV
jgi:hypothetical protein